MVNALNSTLQAMNAISQELKQVREAILESRAIIGCLLSCYNHSCEEFKDLCCLTLSDNTQLIEQKVQQVKEAILKVTQREGFFSLHLSK